MFVDRHAVELLIEWSANPPVDQEKLRRWLATLVDRATLPARAEFAKAVESGAYPLNAITPKGPPKKPSDISLTIDRAPAAAILILNEVQDPDLLDPENEVKGALQDELLRAFAFWDTDVLTSMRGPDGWRKGEAPADPPEGDQGADQAAEDDNSEPAPPEPEGNDNSKPAPDSKSGQKPPPPEQDPEAMNWEPYKPYLYGLGAMTVLGVGFWIARRKATR